MAQQKLRWGVMGTARIADQLVRAWTLSDTGRLVAIASRDLERAQVWSERHNVAHIFGSYADMLASDEIDAVYIPLPNNLHMEWTIKAAQQGKHVLCEKPLALNAGEVAEMIAARDQYGVKIMEAFMYRFHPKTIRVQEMVKTGAMGALKIIRATFTFYLRDPRNMRINKSLGGGSLMDVGCYPVNIALMMAGSKPRAVLAHALWGEDAAKVPANVTEVRTLTGEDAPQVGVDHTMTAILEFADDVMAVTDWSFRADINQGLSLSGTTGHIRVVTPFRMGEEDQSITYTHEGKYDEIPVRGANEYQMMVDHFADAVLNNKPLSYPLEQSLDQAQTIDALYESARTGKRVVL